jgi:TnpA family transposase
LERRQVAFVNQRHITEDKLNEAITTVINGYNEFSLPKIWGLGKHASADGTKWDLYTQNLLSEYHLRYGGYAGIGYYLVSDMYIALFSRFTTCGSWEGHNILDFIVENEAEVQPDTVHADTQGQSTAIFGLAHLLVFSSSRVFAIGRACTSSVLIPIFVTNISISCSQSGSIGI